MDGVWYLCTVDARFVNHSYNPNTQQISEDNQDWIATMDIASGEEITSDYRSFCLDCRNGLGFDNKE